MPLPQTTLAVTPWLTTYWGSEKRKVAVTVELLLEVYAVLDVTSWDDLVLVTATSTAFGFLMRSAEYSRKGTTLIPKNNTKIPKSIKQ